MAMLIPIIGSPTSAPATRPVVRSGRLPLILATAKNTTPTTTPIAKN